MVAFVRGGINFSFVMFAFLAELELAEFIVKSGEEKPGVGVTNPYPSGWWGSSQHLHQIITKVSSAEN